MTKRIIYPTQDGGVAVIVPAADSGLTIEQIATKDVPANTPYKIINTEDVPSDRTFRAAWEADMTSPDGVAMGADAWFAEIERERQIEEAAARHKAEIAAQAAALIEANTPTPSEETPVEATY